MSRLIHLNGPPGIGKSTLANGHDVVLPQMLVDQTQLARFEACAVGVDQVRAIVAASGGDDTLTRFHAALERLLADRPNAVVVMSADGAAEETYRSLVASLG